MTTLKIILHTVKNFTEGAPSTGSDLNNVIIRKSRDSIFNIHLAFIHHLKIQTYWVNTSTGTTLYHRTSLLPEFHNTSAIQLAEDGNASNLTNIEKWQEHVLKKNTHFANLSRTVYKQHVFMSCPCKILWENTTYRYKYVTIFYRWC